MQINRLFEIIYILLNKKKVTAKELAEHFEVSIRTIYRDVDILASANIPIYASQGKGGGISLLDNYILNKSMLSENEQSEVLFALQSLTALQYPEVDKTLTKLSSLFNKDKINWIEVDFSLWGSNKACKEQFNTLKNAIVNHKIITFEYFNSLGEKNIRRVEPVKLLFKSRAWYLQGFCLSKKANRTFKITRMSEVQITEDYFIEKSQVELIVDIKDKESTKLVDLLLSITPNGAHRILEDFDEKDVIKNEDGSYTVSTSLPEGAWLINYILSFGMDIEVLGPKNIRDAICHKLDCMVAKYKKKYP